VQADGHEKEACQNAVSWLSPDKNLRILEIRHRHCSHALEWASGYGATKVVTALLLPRFLDEIFILLVCGLV
jgi:hypothetical protein